MLLYIPSVTAASKYLSMQHRGGISPHNTKCVAYTDKIAGRQLNLLPHKVSSTRPLHRLKFLGPARPATAQPGLQFHYELLWAYAICIKGNIIRSSAIADGPHDAMCPSKSCQLLHNSVGTTCMTSPEQIEVMELEGYSWPTYNKLVHSAMTCSTVVGVIYKLTVESTSLLIT